MSIGHVTSEHVSIGHVTTRNVYRFEKRSNESQTSSEPNPLGVTSPQKPRAVGVRVGGPAFLVLSSRRPPAPSVRTCSASRRNIRVIQRAAATERSYLICTAGRFTMLC